MPPAGSSENSPVRKGKMYILLFIINIWPVGPWIFMLVVCSWIFEYYSHGTIKCSLITVLLEMSIQKSLFIWFINSINHLKTTKTLDTLECYKFTIKMYLQLKVHKSAKKKRKEKKRIICNALYFNTSWTHWFLRVSIGWTQHRGSFTSQCHWKM